MGAGPDRRQASAPEGQRTTNPEFLREGAAIDDYMLPDRMVGLDGESPRARKVMADIYRPLTLRDLTLVWTDLESAEMIKDAADAT